MTLRPLHTQTMKTTLCPVKFDEHSRGHGKIGEICNFHVHTALLLHHCQVLTASNTFILGSYYTTITYTSGPISSYQLLSLRQRSHCMLFIMFSLQPSCPYKYYDKCCSTSFNLENSTCQHPQPCHRNHPLNQIEVISVSPLNTCTI